LRQVSGGLIEALAFAAAVFLYIWVLRPSAGWTLWLLVAWAGSALAWHGETLDSLGLSPRRSVETVAAWRYFWLAALLALGLVLRERLAEPRLLVQGGAYFLWCCIQQTVYQNLVYRRVRQSLGAGQEAWLLSGLIFGFVHLPNPVLVPATALWGAASSYLFERQPSIPALAVVQVTLSSLLYNLIPWEWHHGFRVGPGYFVP